MYYFYGKSNQGHGICPLYRGCLPLGESVIRGFTVVLHYCSVDRITCTNIGKAEIKQIAVDVITSVKDFRCLW